MKPLSPAALDALERHEKGTPLPPRPQTRDNWPLIVTALLLFWPLGVVLLITRPQRAAKKVVVKPVLTLAEQKEQQAARTDAQVAIADLLRVLSMFFGFLFLIGALCGIPFLAGIGFFIAVPSFAIAVMLASHVDGKRKNYMYWRNYNKWK